MRIILSDAVLADATQWQDIGSLLDRARRGRCYIDTLNPDATLSNPWLGQASMHQKQQWQTVTDWSAKDGAIFRLRTLIADILPNPAARPARITLADAIELVDRGVSLWLENGRNDRRFFLAMMPIEQRKMYIYLEAKRIIRFENGGGLGELRKALEEFAARGALDPRADRLLFDSDAEVPGHRSKDATAMVDFCERAKLEYLCLSRRAIENYIPRSALWAWAKSNGRKAHLERTPKLEAFKRMSDAQQRHFHMKSGWQVSPSAAVSTFYASVPAADHAILANGIHPDIACLYATYVDFMHKWVADEGMDADLQVAIDAITDWIRVPYA
jgi:hypothetical protein